MNTVTFPVCAGSMTTSNIEGIYSLNCSVAWGQSTGILLDTSYSAQLDFLLNQSAIDWNAVGIAFSASMAFFLLGVKAGAFFKLTKRIR